MVKLLIHASDVHIRTYQYHDMYKKQLQLFIKDIDEKINGYGYDEVRIVLTGDLVHQKISISNEQSMLVSWLLAELSKKAKVIILPGNHDFLMNNQDRLDSITPIIEMLNNNNIVYYKDTGVFDDDNIKWVVYSLYDNNKKPEFKNNNDGFYVGLYHGQIEGMVTDLGFTFEDSFDKLNFIGCDLVLCGDIHKRQHTELPDGTMVIMIGSLIQQDFGENINEHGYGTYNLETEEYNFHDIPNEQAFLHFKINDIEDIENEAELLFNDK